MQLATHESKTGRSHASSLKPGSTVSKLFEHITLRTFFTSVFVCSCIYFDILIKLQVMREWQCKAHVIYLGVHCSQMAAIQGKDG